MNKIVKIFLGLALVLVGQTAMAEMFFGSTPAGKAACFAAEKNGTAETYEPTGRAKGYDDLSRIADHDLVGLERKACVKMDTMNGIQWVFQPQRTKFYVKDAVAKFHGKCRNKVYEVAYIEPEPEPTPDVPPPAPAASTQLPPPVDGLPQGGCTTDGCNTLTGDQAFNQVIRRSAICKDDVYGTTFAPVNGRCNFQPITADLQAVGVSHISCGNNCTQRVMTRGQAPQAPAGCNGTNCRARFNQSGMEPRADGRCVVSVTFQGVERFIRIGPEKTGSGRLMAAIVHDKKGDLDESLPLVYVGADDRFLHPYQGCPAAVKGFTSDISYTSTTRRLGMPGCTFNGPV